MQTIKLWSIQHRNEKDMPSTSDVRVCERETDRQTEMGDCAKGRDSKDKMRGGRECSGGHNSVWGNPRVFLRT